MFSLFCFIVNGRQMFHEAKFRFYKGRSDPQLKSTDGQERERESARVHGVRSEHDMAKLKN